MGTALNALSSLIHLEPPTTLESRYYYYPHFTDEETETRDEVACPRSHSWRGQSPNLNPGPKIVPSVEPLPWADAFLVSPYVGLTKEDVITVVVLQLRLRQGNSSLAQGLCSGPRAASPACFTQRQVRTGHCLSLVQFLFCK